MVDVSISMSKCSYPLLSFIFKVYFYIVFIMYSHKTMQIYTFFFYIHNVPALGDFWLFDTWLLWPMTVCNFSKKLSATKKRESYSNITSSFDSHIWSCFIKIWYNIDEFIRYIYILLRISAKQTSYKISITYNAV